MDEYEKNNQEPNFIMVDKPEEPKKEDISPAYVHGDIYGDVYGTSVEEDNIEAERETGFDKSENKPASAEHPSPAGDYVYNQSGAYQQQGPQQGFQQEPQQQGFGGPAYEHVNIGQGGFDPNAGKKARKQKVKKEPRYITMKAFVLTLIICMLATSGLTVGGLVLANNAGITTIGKSVSATNYSLSQATGSEKSIEEIIAMNENAVVEIRTESVATDFWLQNYVTEGAGSGVVVDTRGYIMTNNHVIDGANKITVTMKDGTELPATLVGTDPNNDVAVIKVTAQNLTAATYGDSSKLSVGDLVIAIGNPLGELGGTATQGIISALDRELTIDNNTLNLLQTDASINPGNSGGGLFDQYGHLVGLVVAKSSGSDVEGLGFAIPINTAAEVAKELIENGSVKRAAIGVSIIDASDIQVAMKYGFRYAGVYIQEVNSKKAKAAGIKEGDMIYYFDDVQIQNANDLTGALTKHKPGDKVKLTLVREDKTVDVEVELVEMQQ